MLGGGGLKQIVVRTAGILGVEALLEGSWVPLRGVISFLSKDRTVFVSGCRRLGLCIGSARPSVAHSS